MFSCRFPNFTALSLACRAFSGFIGSTSISDIDADMQQHVQNAIERIASEVSRLLVLFVLNQILLKDNTESEVQICSDKVISITIKLP